jgi:lysophospholipase L1-like esterase
MIQPDGKLAKDALPDGLHLSGKGYKIWADGIQAKIDEFVGRPRPQ